MKPPRKPKDCPPISRLHELFDLRYGMLIRKIATSKRVKKGQRAGSLDMDSGYRCVEIDGISFKEHRVILAMHNGYWSENEIDHINHIRDDNRPENLREVSRQCNMRNSKTQINNVTGIKGIHITPNGMYRAYIQIDGKSVKLGCYCTPLLAARIRARAEIEHGFRTCDIDSPASRYVKENSRTENS